MDGDVDDIDNEMPGVFDIAVADAPDAMFDVPTVPAGANATPDDIDALEPARAVCVPRGVVNCGFTFIAASSTSRLWTFAALSFEFTVSFKRVVVGGPSSMSAKSILLKSKFPSSVVCPK